MSTLPIIFDVVFVVAGTNMQLGGAHWVHTKLQRHEAIFINIFPLGLDICKDMHIS